MDKDLIGFNWTVDNVKQGDRILFRYNDQVLTEASLISNQKDIPGAIGEVSYDVQLLDTFVGLNVKDWDGNSPMTSYLRLDGTIDHSVKTGSATAAA